MAVPIRCLSHQHGRKRVMSCESAAGIQTVSESLPKRRASSASQRFSAPPDNLLLHWTMKRLLAEFLLGKLTFTRSAALELSTLCKSISDGLRAVTTKQKCDPSVRWSREYYARFAVGRILESRYNGTFYKTPAAGQDVFVYMKCRYEKLSWYSAINYKSISPGDLLMQYALYFVIRAFRTPSSSQTDHSTAQKLVVISSERVSRLRFPTTPTTAAK